MSSYGRSGSELNDPANIPLRPSKDSSHSLSASHQQSTGSVNPTCYTTPPPTGRRFRPLPPVPNLPHNSVAITEVWQPSTARQCRPLPVPPYHGCSMSLSGPQTPVPPLRRAASLPQSTSTGQMMSERRRKKSPLLVLDSPTVASMLTRQHASNSFPAVSESAAPAIQFSQPLSRVSSLSSVASSTSESPGTDLGSPETPFCREHPRREARIFVVPNHDDLEQPHSIEGIKPSPSEATPSAEIASPAKSQHLGLAGLNCISHRRYAPTPTALATVKQTQCRSDCKHPAALTIRIPMSTSSLPSTETSSESGRSSPCLTPITPQSPSLLRRRRFSKLRRHFGEAPPAAMVFGSEPSPREGSESNMRCADAPRLPTKKWVWDKGGRRRTASNYADVVQYLREL
ncbi:hypothetical protein EDD16DRAFT_177515 [Pisolithus croceorrhizus]|nr:hypothetical protein EDD16DRAFT_177515 [Pisolithus croceorrhizus]KAI6165233.1 hypothetical protein EDD17DRAFT_275356 [Pisolithus thermaeus]